MKIYLTWNNRKSLFHFLLEKNVHFFTYTDTVAYCNMCTHGMEKKCNHLQTGHSNSATATLPLWLSFSLSFSWSVSFAPPPPFSLTPTPSSLCVSSALLEPSSLLYPFPLCWLASSEVCDLLSPSPNRCLGKRPQHTLTRRRAMSGFL